MAGARGPQPLVALGQLSWHQGREACRLLPAGPHHVTREESVTEFCVVVAHVETLVPVGFTGLEQYNIFTRKTGVTDQCVNVLSHRDPPAQPACNPLWCGPPIVTNSFPAQTYNSLSTEPSSCSCSPHVSPFQLCLSPLFYGLEGSLLFPSFATREK